MRFDKQIVAFANAKRERERERERVIHSQNHFIILHLLAMTKTLFVILSEAKYLKTLATEIFRSLRSLNMTTKKLFNMTMLNSEIFQLFQSLNPQDLRAKRSNHMTKHEIATNPLTRILAMTALFVILRAQPEVSQKKNKRDISLTLNMTKIPPLRVRRQLSKAIQLKA